METVIFYKKVFFLPEEHDTITSMETAALRPIGTAARLLFSCVRNRVRLSAEL